MANKKVFTDESLATFVDEIKSYTDDAVSTKANSSHTHNYAGSSSAGGAATSANKVNKTITVQLNGGTTEGTNKFTFDGSVAKSMNITASSVGAAASSHTHDDRYYTESEIDSKVSTLNTAINGKAASSHTHSISNVTNLQSSLDAKQATITGGASTITSSNLTASRALVSDSSGKVAVSAVTSTELGYLDGVTSAIQTQLDGKAASSHNHAASNITSGTLSSDRLPTVPIAKGGTGATTAAAALTNLGITATATELNYVDGVTSNIQTQLDGKAASSHNHSASNITSGTLAIARGGTGNGNGYIQTGALSDTTVGVLATAEGRNVTASGSYCHAEGNYTEASGSSAHAEGQTSTASGIASHAEGNNTTASGNYSHAEGDSVTASAKNAHAEGSYTLASSECQHVQGRYNVEDKAGTYAHIVGNGTGTSARSNAHTLDWSGNAWFAGDVYVGGTSQSDASAVATKAYVEQLIGGIENGSY